MEFIEQNCSIELEGKIFSASGAYIAGDRALCYLKLPNGDQPYARGTVTDWHGNELGACVVTARWCTPRSWVSSHMLQVEATINGRVYTGRSAGDGMLWAGKVKKA